MAEAPQAPSKPSLISRILGNNPTPVPTKSNPTPGNPAADPNNPTPAPTPQPPQDPNGNPNPENLLDGLQQILENNKNPTGQPAPEVPNMTELLQDPKVMEKIVGASNLQIQVTPEMAQAFQSGNPEKIGEVLQSIQTSTFTQALQQAALIGQMGMEQQIKAIQENLPTQLKNQVIDNQLSELNPAMNKPIVQQTLGLVKDALVSQDPNANANEVNEALGAFVTELAQALNPSTEPAPPEDSTKVQDWTKWINRDN